MAKSTGAPRWKQWIDKVGLKFNLPILLLMIKGSIAPTIGLAIYQNTSVATHYSTIGYLIPIMSIFVVPVLPRARFLQNLVVTCLLTCLVAAISLLFMWTAIKARQNTTHVPKDDRSNGPVPGTEIVTYNAAASACLGVWFFFWLWLYNTFRAYRPQYFLPLIVFSIFLNVTATYGTIFPTMSQAYSLVKRLLDAFFVGFGIATAVSLLILPITSRDIVTVSLVEYLHHLKAVLDAQDQFATSLPTRDWYGKNKSRDSDGGIHNRDNVGQRLTPWPEADALRAATAKATESQLKIQSELRYVKREMAWGKLEAQDFVSIVKLLKNILIPILGMETRIEVADRYEIQGSSPSVRTRRGDHALAAPELRSVEGSEMEQWQRLCGQLHPPVQRILQAMIEGLDYAFYTLELTKRPVFTTKTDLEAKGFDHSPGGRGIALHLEKMIQNSLKEREGPMKEWCRWNGMDHFVERHSNNPLFQRHQSQLYLVLDLEYSLITTAAGILDLIRFADSKVANGTMEKKRLLLPTMKQMKKWGWACLSREDNNLDYQTYSKRSGSPTVSLGDALGVERDAEHLPPENLWERSTDKLRVIYHFFGSPESYFGFKVATGTMVIALACYLRNSQEFYIKQRIIWGAIMVAISMSQTAGSGMYGQMLRFFGTFLAMAISYIDWYIVDGHTAGVIVFVGITMFLYHYLLITEPEDPVIPMIGMITVILIVGYELQVKQVGLLVSVSNGQVYHPTYELAPYRLAAVGGGVSVAFFFTYFPSVTTARTKLRKDLGATLYLLGQYYSSTYKTVSLGFKGLEGDIAEKESAVRRLQKARGKLFTKQLVLIQGMKSNCRFILWEPTIGGKFPKEIYERLLSRTRNILRLTAMIAFVTTSFRDLREDTHSDSVRPALDASWLRDAKKLIATLELTSHSTTTLLAIISSALSTGKPLPPYLKAPDPYDIGDMLSDLDGNILSTKYVCEAGYAAFAVMQLSTTKLADELAGLLVDTKMLVGEAEFDLGIVPGEGRTKNIDPKQAAQEEALKQTQSE